MKKQLFIANWKSHKIPQETEEWFENFPRYVGTPHEESTIIVCPPSPLLSEAKALAGKHCPFVQIGAQDVSYFSEGAYTGEVSSRLVASYATHVIIGHSERRSYFAENEKILAKKVVLAKANMLTPIFCVSNLDEDIPHDVSIVAYEPLEAIGSGNPQDPATVEKIAQSLKQKHEHVSFVLYGGSVDDTNVALYTRLPSINGVLVGGASLDAQKFASIITHHEN